MAGTLRYRRATMKLGFLEEKPVVFKLRQLTYPVIKGENLLAYVAQSAHVPVSSIRSTVAAIVQAIVYFVINGHAVHFNNFGTFHLKLQQKVQKSEQDVSLDGVKKLMISFITHKELRAQIANINYENYGTVSLSNE